MTSAVAFWLASLAIAALALPIAHRLFARFPDGGAGLAFPIGTVLASYLYFILRVLHVLPPGRGGFVLAVLLLGLVGAWFAGDRRFRATVWRSANGTLIAAGLFTGTFFAVTAIRSYTPDIVGTEQPMDFMYLNSVVNSPEYPPEDPWLAGEAASYYYFGYIQVGLLNEVAGTETSTGYNLGLAYTFAASAAAVGSLAAALSRWVVPWRRQLPMGAGATAVWLLLFCGSLAILFEWFAVHGNANESIFGLFDMKHRISCAVDNRDSCAEGIAGVSRTARWYPDFWFASFFSMTRLIPGTITEFPVFSFMLGDLHPHVTAIPLVLLTIGLAAAAFRGRGVLSWGTHRARPIEAVLLAIFFGALAFQNAWDVLTFSTVLAIAVAARNLRSGDFQDAAIGFVTYLVPLAVAAVVLYIPWYLDFSSQASGLYPYVGEGSSPAHVFLQWGPLILASMLTLGFLRRSELSMTASNIGYTAWIPIAPFGLWAVLALFHSDLNSGLDERGIKGWVTLVILGLCVAALASAFFTLARRRSAAALPTALAMVGMLLLYGSELLLIRDVFFGGSPRLNTVFKLSYQAWILLSVAGATAFMSLLATAFGRRSSTASRPTSYDDVVAEADADSRPVQAAGGRGLRLAPWMAGVAGVLIILAGTYTLLGVPSRTNGFGNESSIDGLSSLSRNDPSEYALVRWIDENVPAGATIVEATGRTWRPGAEGQPMVTDVSTDYTDSGRIAARTGRAAPIGWYFHEVQWRGESESVRSELTRRQDLVDRVYTARDPGVSMAAMQELGAEYVVLGRIELEEYDASLRTEFSQFLDLVFEAGDFRVYRLPVAARPLKTS